MTTTTGQTPIDEDLIARLKAANPGAELNQFTNEEFGVALIVKTPKMPDYQGWRAQQSAAGDDIVPINRAFVQLHVVHPTPVEFSRTLSEHPMLLEPLIRYIVKLAGARAEFTVKKL
jgi:hypothetical protein